MWKLLLSGALVSAFAVIYGVAVVVSHVLNDNDENEDDDDDDYERRLE